MIHLRTLPTLADAQAEKRATGKYESPSRLAQRLARQKDDARVLADAKRIVWMRDAYQCRCCTCAVSRDLERHATRGEIHHIVTRKFKALRTDVRNLVLLCPTCHEDVQRYRMKIRQPKKDRFSLEPFSAPYGWIDKSFINADKPVSFEKA